MGTFGNLLILTLMAPTEYSVEHADQQFKEDQRRGLKNSYPIHDPVRPRLSSL